MSFSAAVLEHLTQRETAVHALDAFGRPLPRGAQDDDAARARTTAVDDDGAEDARHGLARVHPVPAPGAPAGRGPDPGDGGGGPDPLAERFDREGLVHPVLLVSGELGRAGAERILRGTARAAAGSAVLVAAPDRVPDGAAALEAAGWSVVVAGTDTAPQDAWARLGTGSRTGAR